MSRSAAPRVGLFGLLGSGNIGNDASLESMLAYLSADHPDAIVDAMCMGPERVQAEYGLAAIPLQWYKQHERSSGGALASGLKVFGKFADVFRTAAWVRRHDAVIVPGMGVLEASLPLKASGVPYAMALMSASGRVFGTRVALVSVGANIINQRLIRQLFNTAARLAFYRSYRDAFSREAMRQRGLDVSRDPVYPDLVFARPAPPQDPGDPMTVGVGVMAYFGTNDHRSQADEIHTTYVATMKRFVRWLADHDRKVRLFVGDGPDNEVAREIQADLLEYRPDLGPDWVIAEPVFSFADLTRAMAPVSSVVATRYHNVICALKLGKPAISLGYAAKNTELMADMGLSEFCQQAHDLDFDQLIAQFTEMERRAPELRATIAARVAANAERAAAQFTQLSGLLFPAAGPRSASAGHRGPRQPVG